MVESPYYLSILTGEASEPGPVPVTALSSNRDIINHRITTHATGTGMHASRSQSYNEEWQAK